MDIYIEPLSKETLKEALALLDKVFGNNPQDKFKYTRAFNATLGSKKHLKMYDAETPSSPWQYYVAIDKDTKKVIGTTGLYAYEEDRKDNAACMGWYCVAPEYRGKGIGKLLLDFTIKEARKLKKSLFRLWTSNSPAERLAHKMYEKRCFYITRKEKNKGDKYETIYMELKL